MRDLLTIAKTIINDSVTKTVASSTTVDPSLFDFPSLHLALRWAETVKCDGGVTITLQLDPGVHVLGGQGEFDDVNWNYYSLSNIRLTIQGDDNVWAAPDSRGDFIITLDAFDDGDNWPNVIDLFGNSFLNLNGVTVDIAHNGYPYTANVYPINSFTGTDNISVYFSDIKNASYGVSIAGGFLNLRDANISNCYYGVNMSGTQLNAYNISFTNCTIAVLANMIKGAFYNSTFTDCSRGLELSNGSSLYCVNLTCTNMKLNAYPIGVRIQSTMIFYGVLSIDSVNKAAYGINVDEDSRLFFDNTTTNSITINNAGTGIVSDGSYVGAEFDIATTISNCDYGYRVAHGGEIYLRGIVPTFTNVTTPYNIERNVIQNEGVIKTDTIPYLTSSFDNTVSSLTSITEKDAIDEIAVNRGLVKITEGANTGWRLHGMDPAFFGDIGVRSIDLSLSTTASTTFGATGYETMAIGYETTASGWAGLAGGYRSVASSDNTLAFGENCVASQPHAVALGFGSQATDHNAFAHGLNCTASGRQSFAAGESSQAQGRWSTAFGNYSVAASDNAFAAGNNASANGNTSIALGYYATATGATSVALGNYTTATGNNSIAMGYVTTALNANSVAMGAYNVGTDVNTLLEFGNGTFGAELNILELYNDGTMTLPDASIAEVESRGAKALITREYFDTPRVVQETSLASFTPDFTSIKYFKYIMNQATTLNNPLNQAIGQEGTITLQQDATGGRTITFGTDYVVPTGGFAINTTANAYNVFKYTVIDTNKILLEFVADFL